MAEQVKEKKSEYIMYALPYYPEKGKPLLYTHCFFHYWTTGICTQLAFNEFDGILVYAGCFETTEWDSQTSRLVPTCNNGDLLNSRERQLNTALKKGIPVIFLVPDLLGSPNLDIDIFRRVALNYSFIIKDCSKPQTNATSRIPEFQDFINDHGVAHYSFYNSTHQESIKVISAAPNGDILGFILNNLFVLPCAKPVDTGQAKKAAEDAITAVETYLHNRKKKFPEWVDDFKFTEEQDLNDKASSLKNELAGVNNKLQLLHSYKGAICFQHEPLVDVVIKIFDDFFDISLTKMDDNIEDARWVKNDGTIIAFLEIKGDRGNAKRIHINQVDSHRERRNQPPELPGILILNSFPSAKSLAEKYQDPGGDIIAKAISSNVLIIRTIDLLEVAKACEARTIKSDQFQEALLTECGWLKLENDKLKIIKE